MLFKKGGANDKPTACPEGYVLETSLSGADGTCVPKEWKEKEQSLTADLDKKYGENWWNDDNPNTEEAWAEYMQKYEVISKEVFGESHDSPLSAAYRVNGKGTEGEKIAPSKGDIEKFANKTGSSKEDLANVLDNVGPGGIEEGVYNKDEATAQTNAANKLAEEEKKKEQKKEEPAAEDDYIDKLWLDKGYEPDGQGGFRVPAGKKLDANGNIVDDVPAPSGAAPTVDDAELKKWNGSKEAYDAFQDAKNNIMNDPDLKKDLIDQYRKVIEDEGSYTGKKSGTKQAFKTKYYDDLSKLEDDDIIKELLAQEERNARLAAFGFDAAKTSQNAGARGGTTNKEADKFAAEHPELSDLDWSGGHRGQAAYIAYNQLMNTDKYKGYAAEQFGVSDESVGGVVGKVSGIDKFSTNTTLGQRLNYKGKTPPPTTPPPGTPPPETPPPTRTPCPPGHYVDEQGNCIKLPEWKPKDEFKLPGLLQLIPVGYAMMNPYQKDKGIPGSPGITGPLMPRVNLNQERASAVSSQVALNTAIQNQNMGPGAISAMIATAGKTNEQMLKIAKQEQDSNKQLAAEESKLGMQASMFNVENEQKRQFANADLRVAEKKYKREEILGTLDAAVNRITGIAKDDRMFKANERLAKAMDETGSYDRFTLYENLQKEAKNKRSPLYGKNEVDLRNMAAGYSKLFYGDKGIVADQFNGQANTQTQTQQKLGGARQYTSRLGELTKRSKLRIK
jgi:ribosomal protein L12E/L44/L45/RPP1/RPP2